MSCLLLALFHRLIVKEECQSDVACMIVMMTMDSHDTIQGILYALVYVHSSLVVSTYGD
jgi:hypothetical protein